MSANDLTELLQSSRDRVLHLIAAISLVMAFISVAALVKIAGDSNGYDVGNLVVWGLGCAAFALLARLWYRARVRAIRQLVTAIRDGSSLYRCKVTSVFVERIPLGHEVDLIVVDAERTTSVHLAFGFWTLASANKLLAILQPHIVAGPPPGIALAMRVPLR